MLNDQFNLQTLAEFNLHSVRISQVAQALSFRFRFRELSFRGRDFFASSTASGAPDGVMGAVMRHVPIRLAKRSSCGVLTFTWALYYYMKYYMEHMKYLESALGNMQRIALCLLMHSARPQTSPKGLLHPTNRTRCTARISALCTHSVHTRRHELSWIINQCSN